MSTWHSNGRNNMGEFQTVLRTPGAQERWMHYCSLSEKDKRKWLKENEVVEFAPTAVQAIATKRANRDRAGIVPVGSDPATVAEMARLRSEGWSHARIALKVGVSETTVQVRLKELEASERPADSLADRETARSAKQ
jgi:hypothetical protein